MPEEKKILELNDEELEKASGGDEISKQPFVNYPNA